ncbi:hypothetical protein GCM10028811_01920 [Uliginosibacterium sediminicola]
MQYRIRLFLMPSEAAGPAHKFPAMKSSFLRGLPPLLRQAPSVLGMSALARLAFALFFIAWLWAGVFWALSA